MPELPEVETISRAVGAAIVGMKLTDATFYRKDVREPIPIREIRKGLVGQTIRAVSRRSKFMLVRTDGGDGVFHFGMAGNVKLLEKPEPILPHTHAVFCFESPRRPRPLYLHFVDPRRFGRIGYIEPSDEARAAEFKDLGPEPLELRAGLGDHLWKTASGRTSAVKNFIMDQRVVVGVGNIYASEALFRARLLPTRAAGKIKSAQFENLAQHICATLDEAIAQGGTTFRDFRHIDGNSGYFRTKLHVYDREGEECHVCSQKIRQVRIGGRSSFFCPKCQR